jgi:hypothetical protein
MDFFEDAFSVACCEFFWATKSFGQSIPFAMQAVLMCMTPMIHPQTIGCWRSQLLEKDGTTITMLFLGLQGLA